MIHFHLFSHICCPVCPLHGVEAQCIDGKTRDCSDQLTGLSLFVCSTLCSVLSNPVVAHNVSLVCAASERLLIRALCVHLYYRFSALLLWPLDSYPQHVGGASCLCSDQNLCDVTTVDTEWLDWKQHSDMHLNSCSYMTHCDHSEIWKFFNTLWNPYSKIHPSNMSA